MVWSEPDHLSQGLADIGPSSRHPRNPICAQASTGVGYSPHRSKMKGLSPPLFYSRAAAAGRPTAVRRCKQC